MGEDVNEGIPISSLPTCDFSKLNVRESLEAVKSLDSGMDFIQKQCEDLDSKLDEIEELKLEDVAEFLLVISKTKDDIALAKFAKDLASRGTSKQQDKFMDVMLKKMEALGYGDKDELLARINKYRTDMSGNLKEVRANLGDVQKYMKKAAKKVSEIFRIQKKLNSPSDPSPPSFDKGIPEDGNDEPPPSMSP